MATASRTKPRFCPSQPGRADHNPTRATHYAESKHTRSPALDGFKSECFVVSMPHVLTVTALVTLFQLTRLLDREAFVVLCAGYWVQHAHDRTFKKEKRQHMMLGWCAAQKKNSGKALGGKCGGSRIAVIFHQRWQKNQGLPERARARQNASRSGARPQKDINTRLTPPREATPPASGDEANFLPWYR